MTLILLLPIGIWLVCRAVDWLPETFAREETAWLDAVRNGQSYESPSVWTYCKTFFTGAPPVNILSGVATLSICTVSLVLGLSHFSSLALVLWFVFACTLVTLALVDYQTRLLPDVLTLPMLWLGLLIQLYPETRTVGLEWSLIGAVAGYLPLWLLAQVYRLLRGRDGIGMGDLKLLAAMGAWSGPLLLPMVLFLAAIFAIASFLVGRVVTRNASGFYEERPFGPWIILAYGVVLVMGS